MPADAATADHSHSEDAPLVSRANQATWGLATATVVFGVALGGIIGLVSAFALGRLGRLTPRASTMLVAGDRLRRGLLRALPEVPAESAGRR